MLALFCLLSFSFELPILTAVKLELSRWLRDKRAVQQTQSSPPFLPNKDKREEKGSHAMPCYAILSHLHCFCWYSGGGSWLVQPSTMPAYSSPPKKNKIKGEAMVGRKRRLNGNHEDLCDLVRILYCIWVKWGHCSILNTEIDCFSVIMMHHFSFCHLSYYDKHCVKSHCLNYLLLLFFWALFYCPTYLPYSRQRACNNRCHCPTAFSFSLAHVYM